MDLKYIIIALVLVIILAICIFLIAAKKKKERQANQPIHKEYDASIENIVNEEKEIKNTVQDIDLNKFKNVGTVATPLIDEPSSETTVLEDTKQSVQEKEIIVDEKKPDVAISTPGQTLENYEITLPEEQNAMNMTQNANVNPTVIKKEPVFMSNIPEEEEEKPVEPKRNEIIIDEPNIEDL